MTPDQYTAHQIDHLFRAEADRVFVFEDTDSVRSPGWFRAQCHECDWETSGTEPVVEQAVSEHVGTHPLGRLLTAVGQAVRERGEKLTRLPETLGQIWTPAGTCGASLSATAYRTRCELPPHGPEKRHHSTQPDGQSRSWTDNECDVLGAGWFDAGHSGSGVQLTTAEREWPANP